MWSRMSAAHSASLAPAATRGTPGRIASRMGWLRPAAGEDRVDEVALGDEPDDALAATLTPTEPIRRSAMSRAASRIGVVPSSATMSRVTCLRIDAMRVLLKGSLTSVTAAAAGSRGGLEKTGPARAGAGPPRARRGSEPVVADGPDPVSMPS